MEDEEKKENEMEKTKEIVKEPIKSEPEKNNSNKIIIILSAVIVILVIILLLVLLGGNKKEDKDKKEEPEKEEKEDISDKDIAIDKMNSHNAKFYYNKYIVDYENKRIINLDGKKLSDIDTSWTIRQGENKSLIIYKTDKKIIIIDGISTTGKSTISDEIFNKFQMNGINVRWLHEESLNDINLTLNLPKHEKIENYKLIEEMNNLYDRWIYFLDSIKNDNVTYILDSNFFKSIHDYMLNSNLNTDQIKKYYNQLINILETQKLYFIFLKRNDIKKSFEDTFKNRGFFWESHFKKHLYEKLEIFIDNDDSTKIYEYEQNYQKLIESIFDNFRVDKIKIITDEEKWDEYVEHIVNDLGLFYFDEVQDNYDYNKYIGDYSCENWNVDIFYDNQKKKMFLSAFWPNIELKYIGNDTFKLKRFPLHLHFIDNKIIFEGDLIWDMKNKYFVKNIDMVKVLKK